jgi:PAS domain S-box-containing protein
MMRHKNVAIAKAGNASTGVSAAERFLLDIIDTVREPLLVLDSDFRVTRANRTFFQTFHVAADTTIGNELFTLGDGQWDIPRLRELLRDRLVAEGELYDVEVEHVFPHIGRKIMMLNARLVTHEPDMPNVILLAIEDVTERRLTERRLATQRLELERSNAALKEFAFVASHDLQEPLRKILSFGERLELAAGSRLDGDARHYLERMLDAATRMRTLITDVLAYSQIATSATPFVPTDLDAIAGEVVSELKMSIVDTGGRVEVGPLPVIDVDAVQMRQLLQNLLGNALKFAARTWRRLSNSTRRWSAAGFAKSRSRTTALASSRSTEKRSFGCSSVCMRGRSIQAPGSVWRFAERLSSATAARSPRRALRVRERRSTSPCQSRGLKRSTQHDDAGQAQDPDHDSHLRR